MIRKHCSLNNGKHPCFLLDSEPYPVLYLDTDGKILHANTHFKNEFHLRNETIEGHTFHDLKVFLHGDSSPLKSFIKAVKKNDFRTCEIEYTCQKTHSQRYFLMIPSKVFNTDQCIGYKIVLIEQTEQKKTLFSLEKNLKKKEKELKQKQKFHETLIKSFPREDAIVFTDSQNKTTYISPNAYALFDYSGRDLRGRNILEFLHPKDFERAQKNIVRMHAGLHDGPVEYTGLKKSGESFEIEINGNIIFSSEKKVEYSVYFLRDISKRKKLESDYRIQSEEYQAMFESSGTAQGLFGDDRIILRCNKAFEELSGLPKDAIEGKKKWTDFIPSPDLERIQVYHLQRSLGKGSPPMQYESRFLSKNGTEKFIRIAIKMLPDKRRVFSLMDITSLVNLQKRLENDLHGMYMVRDDFVRLMYYRLAEPLNNSLGFLQFVLSKNDVQGSIRESIETSEKNMQIIHKMLDRIRSYYDIINIRPRNDKLKKKDLETGIEEHIKNLRNKYVFKNTILVSIVVSELKTDHNIFHSICDELILNAVYASSEDTPIEIRLEYNTEKNIIFSVIDKGNGIVAENKSRVFDPFFQENQDQRQSSGWGMGLSFVRRYCQLLNAEISLESRLGSGTTVQIHFPQTNNDE